MYGVQIIGPVIQNFVVSCRFVNREALETRG